MELRIIEKWQHGSAVELFYNSTQRRLVFKKFNYLYSIDVDDFKSLPYMDLQDFSSPFLSLCFSPNGSILAFQRNTHDLEFLLIEQNQHFVLFGKNKTIIGYHWLSHSLYSDIVVIDSSGVEFYKLFPKLSKILTVRHYQLSIGHYWFDSSEGVLVAASSPPKLGQFSTFFINQSKGAKFFNGQRINIDLSPSVTDKWTESLNNISSLSSKIEPASTASPHAVNLLYLYGNTYFTHVNCLTGSLALYKMTHEKIIKIIENFSIPTGTCGIRAIDSLLVLQNYSRQETYIVDIKSSRYGNKQFYTFWNNMKDSLPDITVKLRLSGMNGTLVIEPEFNYDGKRLIRTEKCIRASEMNGSVTECSITLDDTLLYIDRDICINTKEGRCYKLTMSYTGIVEKHPDQVESMLFLLRRNNCKIMALQYLKQCLRQKISLKVVSEFFSIICAYYKIAALEKKKKRLQLPDLNSRKTSTTSESDLYYEEGMTMLLQSDVFSILFQPLLDDKLMNSNYLLLYVQEYVRSLLNQDIQVQINLQILLAKILLKSKQYLQLQQYLQYHIIADSAEILGLMLGYVSEFQNFLQIAVDMMLRLKKFDKLVDFLIEKRYYFEALKIVEFSNVEKIDVMKAIARSLQGGDEKIILMVTKLIQEWALIDTR